jgi:predicted Zn-dependent protease
MKKFILELISTLVLFFGIFLLAKQVDWIRLLHVNQIRSKTEEKLGELLKEILNKDKTACEQPEILYPVDSLLTHLCEANGIEENIVKISVFYEDEVNAFALPGNQIVIYTGLIEATANEAALSGVLAHELAHLQKRHVMSRLIREMGVAVLLSAASGGAAETLTSILQMLSSASYDRAMEKEADLTAAIYLTKAKISAEPFAALLLELDEPDTPNFLAWISTHPSGEKRARDIRDQFPGKNQPISQPVLAPETWDLMKKYNGQLADTEN